jgi:hypothetical protein
LRIDIDSIKAVEDKVCMDRDVFDATGMFTKNIPVVLRVPVLGRGYQAAMARGVNGARDAACMGGDRWGELALPGAGN